MAFCGFLGLALVSLCCQGTSAITNSDLPPFASGIPRGSEALLGYGGEPVSGTAVVNNPQYVGSQLESPNYDVYLDFTKVDRPQPQRGARGGTDPGHRNSIYDQQNSDLFIAPSSDSGDVPNAKWPMGLSHNRGGVKSAGWARQQNIDVLPVATEIAGVDMRLEPHAYRELHWHTAAEWSLILEGTVRLSAVDEDGRTFVDDLSAGDVWFFPPGVPHSIQAGANGTEFLLVFNEGDFSEDATFLVSEMFLRNPKSVIAKNFRSDVSDFENLPTDELYIFPGTPFPANISEQNVTGPAGSLPASSTYSYHFSQQAPVTVPGGNFKIIDPESFPIAKEFSAALVTIEPGAMRELHWHLTADEWSFFISGQGRLTAFSAPSSSRTFDFQAGDVGYVPVAQSHYLENTGTEPLVYLEALKAPRYSSISVAQWLGLTPKQVIKDTLNLPDAVVNNLPKYEQFIVNGDTNLTATNFTRFRASGGELKGADGLRKRGVMFSA